VANRLDPEAELVARAAAGSREDFEGLYETYFPRVYAFAVRRLGARDAAERVTRRVLLDLVEHLPLAPTDLVAEWIFERTCRQIDRTRARSPRPDA
jgi:DNA-directed RNA polymerase specialized sigma24 family protein